MTMSRTLALLATALFSLPALAAGPTDPQIAQIVVTANSVDVQAGRLAAKKTRNAKVKKFAELMVTDHSAVNKSAGALVKKLGVKPVASEASKGLQKGGNQNLAHLRKLKGAAFDKAYVDHEVAYHVAVLDTIDKVLIPNAQNAELKALIQQVRPTIAAHLEHAKKLQASLEK